MKITIGHIITVVMIGFMTFILYMVYTVSSTNIDLYADDYYVQELDYGSVVEAQSNSKGYEDEITLTQDGGFTKINFSPKLKINESSGTIHFYKPNNDDADKLFQFSPENSIQVFKSADFEKGNYLVKFSWTRDSVNYFVEKSFIIK